ARRVIELERAVAGSGEDGVHVGRAPKLECRHAADRRTAAAGDIAMDGNVATVRPQAAGITYPALHDETAATDRLERTRIRDRVASGIDNERVAPVGVDRPLVDQGQLPGAKLAG